MVVCCKLKTPIPHFAGVYCKLKRPIPHFAGKHKEDQINSRKSVFSMEPSEQECPMYAKLLPQFFTFVWFLRTGSAVQTVLCDREVTNGCGRMWSRHSAKYCTCTVSSEKHTVRMDCGINRMLNYALCDSRRSWNTEAAARIRRGLGNEFPFC